MLAFTEGDDVLGHLLKHMKIIIKIHHHTEKHISTVLW
jgi:hypothetical protein